MLFPMFLWGSRRASTPPTYRRADPRLLDDCPNIVAIKAEGGFPSIMGVIECHRLFGDEVVISCPIEGDLIPLSEVMPIRLSRHERPRVLRPDDPTVFKLSAARRVRRRDRDLLAAAPRPQSKGGVAPQLHGGAFINRQAWKFQAWLQGYNGGPLRQPTQRIHDAQMNALRKGLIDSGLEPSMDPFAEFFVGRNPA